MLPNYLKALKLCLILVLLGSSCKEVGSNIEDVVPEPTGPSWQLEVNGTKNPLSVTVDVGDTLYISVTAASDAFLETIAGYRYKDNDREVLFQEIIDSTMAEKSIDSIQQYFDYTYSGKDLNYLFVLTDQLDQADSLVLNVKVNESPIQLIENRLLAPYQHSSLGNFYNVLADTAYFPANLRVNTSNQESVDFIVSYSKNSQFAINAPDDTSAVTTWNKYVTYQWPFQKPNSTRFVQLDESIDFDAIVTSVQLEDLFDGPEVASLSMLAEGDVFAFKLDRSRQEKIGILKVVDLSGSSESTRTLALSLKVQE